MHREAQRPELVDGARAEATPGAPRRRRRPSSWIARRRVGGAARRSRASAAAAARRARGRASARGRSAMRCSWFGCRRSPGQQARERGGGACPRDGGAESDGSEAEGSSEAREGSGTAGRRGRRPSGHSKSEARRCSRARSTRASRGTRARRRHLTRAVGLRLIACRLALSRAVDAPPPLLLALGPHATASRQTGRTSPSNASMTCGDGRHLERKRGSLAHLRVVRSCSRRQSQPSRAAAPTKPRSKRPRSPGRGRRGEVPAALGKTEIAKARRASSCLTASSSVQQENVYKLHDAYGGERRVHVPRPRDGAAPNVGGRRARRPPRRSGRHGLDPAPRHLQQWRLAAMLAMASSNEALRYVSYPTQVLGKSCKMVPVMAGGIVLGGKRFSLVEYVQVALITVGVVVFNLGGARKKGGAKDSPLRPRAHRRLAAPRRRHRRAAGQGEASAAGCSTFDAARSSCRRFTSR